ncbi:MAG: bifunctional pyr operon transcriptional regulator/uracil phosphoribosyltransferase PyrR [Verrucomicrobiota bacterium JB023]|nr:bifunctional pyr operon transcriptional regulator/uracil phosphoribosyltransferase PyrR [Verrucomicrobiota bacterium JB023]
MAVLMDAGEIEKAVDTLAESILGKTTEEVAIVGIRRRGDEVAERVCERLKAAGRSFQFGILDISLYRDDLAHLTENPKLQSSDIPFVVDGAHVILVDDVLFTGRTIRAALDALTDYGRPGKIELAVLIDRGWRELPIQPDYVGKALETERLDEVVVSLRDTDGADAVKLEQKD